MASVPALPHPRRRQAWRWALGLTLVVLVTYVAVSLVDGLTNGASALVSANPTWPVVALVGVGAASMRARRPGTAAWMAGPLGALCYWRPPPPRAERGAAGEGWPAEATEVLGWARERAVLLGLAPGAWVADVACCYLA